MSEIRELIKVQLSAIAARIEPTICDTHRDGATTIEGRITGDDYAFLMAIAANGYGLRIVTAPDGRLDFRDEGAE